MDNKNISQSRNDSITWISHIPVHRWNIKQVGIWLTENRLGNYTDLFEENDINGEVLLEINHSLLKDELNITSVGERVKILSALNRLSSGIFSIDEQTEKYMLYKEKHNNKYRENPQTQTMNTRRHSMIINPTTSLDTINIRNNNLSLRRNISNEKDNGSYQLKTSLSATSISPPKPDIDDSIIGMYTNDIYTEPLIRNFSDTSIPTINEEPKKNIYITLISPSMGKHTKMIDISGIDNAKSLMKVIIVEFNIVDSFTNWDLYLTEKGSPLTENEISWICNQNGKVSHDHFVLMRKQHLKNADLLKKQIEKIEILFGGNPKDNPNPYQTSFSPSITPPPPNYNISNYKPTSKLEKIFGEKPPEYLIHRKLKEYYNERPPSELITSNINKYFSNNNRKSIKMIYDEDSENENINSLKNLNITPEPPKGCLPISQSQPNLLINTQQPYYPKYNTMDYLKSSKSAKTLNDKFSALDNSSAKSTKYNNILNLDYSSKSSNEKISSLNYTPNSSGNNNINKSSPKSSSSITNDKYGGESGSGKTKHSASGDRHKGERHQIKHEKHSDKHERKYDIEKSKDKDISPSSSKHKKVHHSKSRDSINNNNNNIVISVRKSSRANPLISSSTLIKKSSDTHLNIKTSLSPSTSKPLLSSNETKSSLSPSSSMESLKISNTYHDSDNISTTPLSSSPEQRSPSSSPSPSKGNNNTYDSYDYHNTDNNSDNEDNFNSSKSTKPATNISSAVNKNSTKSPSPTHSISSTTTPSTSGSSIKWRKGALIGAGSYGEVYLGMNRSNGELMAIKQVEFKDNGKADKFINSLKQEIDILKDLHHKNIVQYYGSQSDDKYFNIFLEYVPGGSILSLLNNYGAFEELLIKTFVRQILEGVAYLHEKGIVHRDIKGANILVDNKGIVKISDFGISKKVDENTVNMKSKMNNRTSFQGSIYWMAPEVIKQLDYTGKADIWSIGCLVLEMITACHPWKDLDQTAAIFKIGSNNIPPIPEDISVELRDFLNRTFDLDFNKRPSAKKLLTHVFIFSENEEEK